jgi:ATP-dependent Clp protease ATP-binding subunit ClpA
LSEKIVPIKKKPGRPKTIAAPSEENELARAIKALVRNQDHAIDEIVPHIVMHRAGLAPEGRPAGIFMLLGPTGSGKTKTVEAVAQVLHGSPKNMLKVDCGEYQLEHEVAKLVGAPPGYLGHRETKPIFSQARLNAAASNNCNLSIVLLDEIEKAAGSLTRIMLGVLDKGQLCLGDNDTVGFEDTLIFMTSNVGVKAVTDAQRGFGFERRVDDRPLADAAKLTKHIAKGKWSPEFLNRIDSQIVFKPLTRVSLLEILDLEVEATNQLIRSRLGMRACILELSAAAKYWLIDHGTSAEYGARFLKRTFERNVIRQLAVAISAGSIIPASRVYVVVDNDKLELTYEGEIAA